jgi:hypothetical protein
MGRDGLDVGEETLADLLLTTTLVQRHLVHHLVRVEVGRRVVKRQVTVFSDPEDAQVRSLALQQGSVARHLRRQVTGVPLDPVKGSRVYTLDNMLG